MSHETDTVDRFLADLAEFPDLTDIVADGGVTSGMVFQQQARHMRTLLARATGTYDADIAALEQSNRLHTKTTTIVVEAGHANRLRAVAAEAALAEAQADLSRAITVLDYYANLGDSPLLPPDTPKIGDPARTFLAEFVS